MESRKTYKGRIEIRGKCRYVRLYGPHRQHVDVMVAWQADVEAYGGNEIRTSDPEVINRLDTALRLYDGPRGLWEEERRLR